MKSMASTAPFRDTDFAGLSSGCPHFCCEVEVYQLLLQEGNIGNPFGLSQQAVLSWLRTTSTKVFSDTSEHMLLKEEALCPFVV
jgi:hypothetical protein